MLAITGCEAMFAGVGHFSKGAMRLAFITWVYPCLILSYLGQGARLISDGDLIIELIFYRSMKLLGEGVYWIVFIFSILATIIASQALVTATFSLYEQLMSFHCAPPLKIKSTSDHHQGQVYIPSLNYIIMLATMGLTAGFQTSERLTHAYVLSTSGVILVTTLLITISIVAVKGWHWALAVTFFIFFIFLDGLFFGAATKRILSGAWFTLAVAIVLSIFLIGWFWFRNLEMSFDSENRVELSRLLTPIRTNEDEKRRGNIKSSASSIKATTEEIDFSSTAETPAIEVSEPEKVDLSRITSTSSGTTAAEEVFAAKTHLFLVDHPQRIKLVRLPVFALFHHPSSSRGAPPTFQAFIHRYPALPSVVAFFTIRVVSLPRIALEDRFVINKYRKFEGFYEVTYRLGFRDQVDMTDIHRPLGQRLISMEQRAGDAAALVRVQTIVEAAKAASIHIFPSYHCTSKFVSDSWSSRVKQQIRGGLLTAFGKLAGLFPETDHFILNEDNVLRVGVNARV